MTGCLASEPEQTHLECSEDLPRGPSLSDGPSPYESGGGRARTEQQAYYRQGR